MRIANRWKVAVYPISSGRNWGYGSRVPAADGCVLLDLGRMNQIVDFNEELGYVTVEPGVTQAQLLLGSHLTFPCPQTVFGVLPHVPAARFFTAAPARPGRKAAARPASPRPPTFSAVPRVTPPDLVTGLPVKHIEAVG